MVWDEYMYMCMYVWLWVDQRYEYAYVCVHIGLRHICVGTTNSALTVKWRRQIKMDP